jgi:SNF2 family DNA or RNA helicase
VTSDGDKTIASILVDYDPVRVAGRLTLAAADSSTVWDRIKLRVLTVPEARQLSDSQIEMPWPAVLATLREFGSREQQATLSFRFRPQGDAIRLIKAFTTEAAQARAARNSLVIRLLPSEIQERLNQVEFTRVLRDFQLRDLSRLLALPHGANFSVPGAGKTTVTLALHLLTRQPGGHLFVVGPKASFPAWSSVIFECMPNALSPGNAEPFTHLKDNAADNERVLRSGATRFLISYDLMVRQQPMLAAYFSRQQVHIVLDEAHRMKAGLDSQRGAFLLNVAPLMARRDILTGTPMPQGPLDLASQLGFLWPGQGLDLKLQRNEQPRSVLGNLYVRTTKSELDLPKPNREYRDVDMLPGQLALYGIVRSEALRQLVRAVERGDSSPDFLSARRSVMRLLQLSTNPLLALRGIAEDVANVDSGVIDTVLQEGVSAKMNAVMKHARELAREGKKSVIWTIFTDTINTLETQLADLNAVSLHGGVPTGSEDDSTTREGRLKRFHADPRCFVLVANPAAAGEGISLHTVCHNAIYLDRSYVSTHYLQSIDRIHRLGLPKGVETNIFIYRTKAPAQLGSIDNSVSRRLAKKIRALQELLDDADLHELALDEEEALDPVDYSIELQDLVDLVAELEGRAGQSTEIG